MAIKLVNGWWVPDVDNYMEYYNGDIPSSIYADVVQALTHVTDFGVAVVSHATVGYDVEPLVSVFTDVHVFCPVPELKEALDQNVLDKGWTNVTTYDTALIHLNVSNISIQWEIQWSDLGATEYFYIAVGGGTIVGEELDDHDFGGRIGFWYINSLGADYYTVLGGRQSQFLGPATSPVIFVHYYPDEDVFERFGDIDPDIRSPWVSDFLEFHNLTEVERFSEGAFRVFAEI